MRRNRLPMLKKATGLLLMIVGFSFLMLGIPSVFQFGLLGTLMFSWLVALIFGVAGFLLVDLGVRRSVRAILIAFGLLIPWSLIMLIQLPDQSQLLLASFVALVGVLFYRQYYQKHKPQKTAHIEGIEEKKKVESQQVPIPKPMHEGLGRRSLLRKIVGSLFLIIGGFLFFTLFPFVMLYISLFKAWLVLIPILLIMTVGYHLFANRKLKAAIQTWIGIVLVTFLPYIFLFPVVYQILSACILVIGFLSSLYWYRSRYLKSRSETIKQDEKTPS